MHKRQRNTKKTNDMVKQHLRYLPRTKLASTHGTRHKLHQLSEPIHNGEDGIETTRLG